MAELPSLEKLIEAFGCLPGVGKRSASRYAMHILSMPEDKARSLSNAILEARARVHFCQQCGNLTETDPCAVCADPRRETQTVCVVERPAGAMAIERGGAYHGLYHVLHGVINPLEGVGPEELGLDHFADTMVSRGIQEVIVATNATAEGEATALYIAAKLTPHGITVTRIAHGVPMGSGLEFTDGLTLDRALQGRTRV